MSKKFMGIEKRGLINFRIFLVEQQFYVNEELTIIQKKYRA